MSIPQGESPRNGFPMLPSQLAVRRESFRQRWPLGISESTHAYEIEPDFEAKVEAEFNKMIEEYVAS